MTGIETALLVGATAVTAAGQVMAGNGAAAAQGFNARLAEAQAVQTQYQAGAEQAAVQRQLRQRQEAARAGAAGSGIDIASGSALDVYLCRLRKLFGDANATARIDNIHGLGFLLSESCQPISS